MMYYGDLPGRYPAIVRDYDAGSRTCRVSIPGISDGADNLPVAEIEYAIGDKSRSGANATEIEILPGDTVWVAFIAGDARYPIITGYRNPKTGNDVTYRRIHHANVEVLAEAVMNLIAGGVLMIKSGAGVTVQAPSVTVQAPSVTVTGNLKVNGALSAAGGITGAGGLSFENHTHTEQGDGASTSSPH